MDSKEFTKSTASKKPHIEELVCSEIPEDDIQCNRNTRNELSRPILIRLFALIWAIFFVETLLSGVMMSLAPYITSAFGQHSLTPTVMVFSQIIGGVTNLSIAKVLDVFGRHYGFLLCTVLGCCGLVALALCQSIEAFAAAQVLFTVGHSGTQYTLSVLVADNSTLQNRGLLQALCTSPVIITCWLAGPIASKFLDGVGWRWCLGMFAILFPVVTVPLYVQLHLRNRRARKSASAKPSNGRRSLLQTCRHHAEQFDLVGLILLSAGCALFLFPFNLFAATKEAWRSPLIFGTLIAGIGSLVLLVIWEARFAKVTLLPYRRLLDQTVMGAFLLSVSMAISYFSWSSYFGSVLQVVNNLNMTDAANVVQVYMGGSAVCSILTGLWIRRTGRYKGICLYIGIPLSFLGMGLLIYLRQPRSSIGGIVVAQIMISFSMGIVMVSEAIAVMAATPPELVAMILAGLGLSMQIGSAIGSTVGAAIWQDVLPRQLRVYLPQIDLAELSHIYEDLPTQLSYPVGSLARLAIDHAYGDAQMSMLIAGTAIWTVGLIGVVMWRDLNVKGMQQSGGHGH